MSLTLPRLYDIVLKSIGHLFCWISLSLGCSDIPLQLNSESTYLSIHISLLFLILIIFGKQYKVSDKWYCILVSFFHDAVNLTIGDAKLGTVAPDRVLHGSAAIFPFTIY